MGKIKKFFQSFVAIFSFIGKKIYQIVSWYKGLWVKFTYNQYDEFVYKRGIVMVFASIAAVVIIPGVLSLILQTTYFLTTYKKETVYLTQSEEIYPDDNIWGVRGCHTQNCSGDSSLYYRIRPSVFHHLWNLQDNGHLFFPDALGSSVPVGLTRCEVVSYGVRTRVMMLFHIYPNILKISCEERLPG